MAEEAKTEALIEDVAKDIGIGDGAEVKDGNPGGAPEAKEPQEGKGDYRTVFKKELRDKIDLKRFPTMESLLESALRPLEEKPEEKPAQETEEAWAEELRKLGMDGVEKTGLAESMRKAGLSIEQAKAVLGAFGEFGKSEQAKAEARTKADADAFFRAKLDADKNAKEVFMNGIRKVANENPDAFLSAKAKGVLRDPLVMQMVYAIGTAETESAPFGSTTGGGARFDPMNPLGFK